MVTIHDAAAAPFSQQSSKDAESLAVFSPGAVKTPPIGAGRRPAVRRNGLPRLGLGS
jgi:hypothetical protein